jgi:uncharacterized protein YecE (DUF72 family)
MTAAYIGTSGWSYPSWENAFYPADLARSRHFEFYATQFPTVEINLTFYRLPARRLVQGWSKKAPEGFVFAVKGSRFITHMKKLANLDGALERFFDRLGPLARRIGVVLWQLPGLLKRDAARLDAFLDRVPKEYRHALEFRHPSWLDDEVFAVLRRHRAAHVSVSSQAMPMDLTVTTDLVYIRFHGLSGGVAHDYSRNELEPWATHIRRQLSRGRSVYAFFNNDAEARAPRNARRLMDMLGQHVVKPFAGPAASARASGHEK